MLNQPQKMQDPRLGPASPWVLFVTFTSLALQGFGGVLPVAQRMLCDQLAWLSQKEFVEMLAVAQILPGPNVCNISLMVGDRFFGWRGAFAALAGMITIPLIIVIVLCALYTQFAMLPAVSGALKGMGGVAGGMIIGSAIKLASSLRRNPLGWPVCLALSAAAFLMIALLRWPLVWVLLGLGIPACLYAWSKVVHDRSGYENPTSAQDKPLLTDKDPLQ